MTTFEKVKKSYIKELIDWNEDKHRVIFSSLSKEHGGVYIASVFSSFSKYFLFMYDTIFIENEKGVAIVTCISEGGIRVEYFEGEYAGNYEWITCDFVGNEDATRRIMIEQMKGYL